MKCDRKALQYKEMNSINILYPPDGSKLIGPKGMIIGTSKTYKSYKDSIIPKNDPPALDIYKDGNHKSRKIAGANGQYSFFTGLFQYTAELPDNGTYQIKVINSLESTIIYSYDILSEEQALSTSHNLLDEFKKDTRLNLKWGYCDAFRNSSTLITLELDGFKTGYFAILNVFINGTLHQSYPLSKWSRHNSTLNNYVVIPPKGEIAIGLWVIDIEKSEVIMIDYKRYLNYASSSL